MENKTTGTFSILDVETVESADFSSAWYVENMAKLETRKYAENEFSDKFSRVYHWIGENRNRVRGLNLEQQEEIMIAEGVIVQDDI